MAGEVGFQTDFKLFRLDAIAPKTQMPRVTLKRNILKRVMTVFDTLNAPTLSKDAVLPKIRK